MDGITCPICQFQVVPTGHYEPEYNQLPRYSDLIRGTGENSPQVAKGSMNKYKVISRYGNHENYFYGESILYSDSEYIFMVDNKVMLILSKNTITSQC